MVEIYDTYYTLVSSNFLTVDTSVYTNTMRNENIIIIFYYFQRRRRVFNLHNNYYKDLNRILYILNISKRSINQLKTNRNPRALKLITTQIPRNPARERLNWCREFFFFFFNTTVYIIFFYAPSNNNRRALPNPLPDVQHKNQQQ